MNPIICVTEFNELTIEAVKVAASFARHWGEPVVLVRSVDERGQFPFPLRSRLVQHDWRRLAVEAKELRRLGFTFEEEVVRGVPEDGIASFAWKSRARLIVVGCNPTHLLDRWALGSIAENICDTSLVPVLAVRSAAPFIPWLEGHHRLNVFAGFDPAARDDAVLNRLDELRGTGPCTITAGLVSDPEADHSKLEPAPVAYREHEFRAEQDDSVRAVSSDLAARDIAVRSVEGKNHPDAVLVAQANEAGADLLVLTSHPRTDLTLLPHRCLARGVLRRAPMNVLCVPEADIEPPRVASMARTQSKGTRAGAVNRSDSAERQTPRASR
jgi:nucleotide-binding universal stress UspA family protein